MTLVRIALDVPGPTGNVRAVGRIRATPTRRRTVGDAIVLPNPFSAALVDGVVIVELAATSADWAWKIDEQTPAAATRYVVVPDSPDVIGYEDLVDVDPATLDPAAEPEAAWDIALDATNARVTALEEAPRGGNVDAVRVVTGTEARPDAVLVFWRDKRDDQTIAPVNMDGDMDVWITEPVEVPPADGISIYGTGAPTGAWVLSTDGAPFITFGRGFYKFNSGDAINGLPDASIVGARAWLPEGAANLPTEVTFYLFDSVADIDAGAPVQTKVVSLAGATAGAWVEGTFDAATPMVADGQIWYVGARFTGAADAGKYAFATGARSNNDAVVSVSGKNIAWTERVAGNRFSWYKLGTGASAEPGDAAQTYGVDILVQP